ncbi:zinc-ribbon domain-containing protein [Shimia sp.]|uniref:zinc-ribbon domain-containing protein n=1 Tax=Shimia sp. TaxID=1954381 RepID=UPI0032972076
MRLTCPNCGAQYEVPDDVIPLAGRDVQCSNCGDTWFQSHPEEETAVAPDDFALSEEQPEDGQTDEDENDRPAFEEVEPPEITFDDDGEDIPAAEAEGDGLFESAENIWSGEDETGSDDKQFDDPEPDSKTDETLADEDRPYDEVFTDDDDIKPDRTPRQRGLDPAVAGVLREEAEHEARAREADTLETQPDLGLSEPENEADRRLLEAKARMRRLRGLPTEEKTEETPPEPAKPDSRRELLPDIEEINSTLRGTADPGRAGSDEPAAPTDTKRRRGFRLGFGIALLVALAAILAYSNDDKIAQAYPPARPYLDAFIENANQGRVWLDSQVTKLFLWLDGFTGSE